MIRRATEADLDACVAMGLRFLEVEYDGAIVGDVERVGAMALQLINSGAMFVGERAGVVVGMIGLVAYGHFLSGEVVASPVCWWVNEDARGSLGMKLLAVGKQWAREQGATRFQASAPNQRTERIYRRLGWTAFEVHYQTRLT